MFVIRPLQPDEPFQWNMGWEATAMDAEARAAGTSSWPSRKSAATWTARGGPAMQACSPSPRKELVEQKHRALCLLVDRQNPARRLYERKGFRDVGFSVPTDTSVIVVADL